MRNVTIQKPVVDLKATGAQIKSLRTKCGYTVHDIQTIFGFEYPQAVYAWESGRTVPTIDNLLVLAHLFDAAVEEIVIQRMIEFEVSRDSDKLEKLCNKNSDDCKLRLSA
ncbi:MAG: helix-turn-helix domain-containing protein [Treponema sp.]|nr:helix-turn-helix domain-containing protein [Treponema sp.]